MATDRAVRFQIETKLAQRVPAVLTFKIKHAPRAFASGMTTVDEIVGGGIPRGCITEVGEAARPGKLPLLYRLSLLLRDSATPVRGWME
ncbi:hypothetical protein RBB75_11590 [Tunturibacter empetritectus]|uniref:Uncharacterized protein n=1 Tax=Tunturiibacter empetritectus TaxID=3069691 RepID=A0AAU7Z851_9BACT